MALPLLETARLALRPRGLDDVDACIDMDLEPAVHRYIPGIAGRSREEHRAAILPKMQAGWPPVGGIWVVEEKVLPGFLGWCGLFPLQDSGLVEIGYRYRTAAWGRGVATEAARAVLEYGFRILGLDPIVAVTHPENLASQRVLAKIGLRREGVGRHYGMDLPFFRLTRAGYDAFAGPAERP